MSGGSFEYKFRQLEYLADDIESMFVNDGKYTERITFGHYEEYDRIGDATPEEREEILKEIRDLIATLRATAKRAKELEWYMSGDTGATTYLKRLKEI